MLWLSLSKSFFFLLSALPVIIQVSGGGAHVAQKNSFIAKLPISKVENFLKSNLA